MNILKRLSPFTWSVGLVGAALAVSLILPVHSHAAGIPKAYPVRDFFANP